VEMYQWREHCSGDECSYDAVWSRQPIDSSRFRQRQGHDNPPWRLADAHFAAERVHVGAYAIAADLLAERGGSAELPVHAADLPPNLAASFGEAAGRLFAGGDPAQPKVGEVRVSYRVLPLGNVEFTGIQRGGSLAAH